MPASKGSSAPFIDRMDIDIDTIDLEERPKYKYVTGPMRQSKAVIGQNHPQG